MSDAQRRILRQIQKGAPGADADDPRKGSNAPLQGRDKVGEGLDSGAMDLRMLGEASQEELRNHLEGLLGKTLLLHLSDPTVATIYRNPNGSVFLRRTTSRKKERIRVEHSDDQAFMLISLIESAYGGSTQRRPHVERALPWYNARFTGTIPPRNDGPQWAIRLFNLADVEIQSYIESKRMTQKHLEAIWRLIDADKNILVVGGQGSGKSTFLRALLNEVGERKPDTRFGIIQDTMEIRLRHADSYTLYSAADDPEATPSALIKSTLRYGAESLSWSEIREFAMSLVEAWTTGTERTGGATIHGSTAAMGMRRLEILEAKDGTPITRDIREANAQAVGALVVTGKSQSGEPGTIRSVETIVDANDSGYRFAAA